jgi:hypothetical protein
MANNDIFLMTRTARHNIGFYKFSVLVLTKTPFAK